MPEDFVDFGRMTPAQKVQLIEALYQTARDQARAGIQRRYPAASPRELFLRLAMLTIGSDLARRAFPEIDRMGLQQPPEDVVLQELRAYGTPESERQWPDNLTMIQSLGQHLDREYLMSCAQVFNVERELERALVEADGR